MFQNIWGNIASYLSTTRLERSGAALSLSLARVICIFGMTPRSTLVHSNFKENCNPSAIIYQDTIEVTAKQIREQK